MFAQSEMMRASSHHAEDDETHDSSSPTESSKRGDRKVNASRSKHSETEQRRRSKINERFQVLRNIIPKSDQKRDKASFLLEVIQYIQFLNDKLHMYEGSCHGWSPGASKSLPLGMNSGPLEGFIDKFQFEKNFSGHEENILHTTMLNNAQNSINMPPPIFGDYCSVPIYGTGEEEPKRSVSEEASVSNLCSEGLLNFLKKSLQSSGVDLSQASISVKLDIGKQTNGAGTNTMFCFKDDEDGSCLDFGAPMNIGEKYEHPPKRFRPDSS